MEKITIESIKKYTNGKLIKNNSIKQITDISIDSREISENTLYIPIIGETHDGHNFMENAYNSGCKNFIIDENHHFQKEDINLIQVKNTTKALGDIAKGYKETLNLKTIAITGSVGKTSTKDIIYSVLKEKYKTNKTEGNLNNEIGLPKTIFELKSETKISILEMGMDKKGEIEYLAKIAKPDIAVITNIGMSHIMNFKDGREGILKAKKEITTTLTEKDLLIINGDDQYLKTIKQSSHKYQILTYGFTKENDIYCTNYQINEEISEFTCVYNKKTYNFKIKTIAKHNIGNALISILIGLRYNLTEEEIQKGLLNITMSKNRLDITKTNKYTIINDTYNASYDSVMSALEILNNFKTRKVAILGDILELGIYSEEIHKKIGKEIKCDLLITIGNNSRYITDEAQKRNINSYHFNTKEDFYKNQNLLLKNDTILVKASRGLELDKVVEILKNN